MQHAPVGRLAPSPTGRLHLGHARSFALAWWQLRGAGGTVLLRLEDLDVSRSTPTHASEQLRDLEWLGLDWDGRPELQSEHLERFHEAIERLAARGLAYPCTCTRGELRGIIAAPHAGDVEPRYPGTCRDRYASLDDAELHSGRDAGWRFRAPAGDDSFVDGLYGEVRGDVQATVGDFLIARRDKTPAYQLAVVVDDAASGVTLVQRGADLLTSTLRQRVLQRALDLPTPSYVHYPLVVDAEGRRLAKRADDLSLGQLREQGVDPRAIVGWIAASAGQSAPERVAARELVPHFDLSRVPLDVVRVDAALVARLEESR